MRYKKTDTLSEGVVNQSSELTKTETQRNIKNNDMYIHKLIDKLDNVEEDFFNLVTTEVYYDIGNFSLYFYSMEVNGDEIQSLEGEFNGKGYIYEWWGNSGMERVYGVDIESILNNLILKTNDMITEDRISIDV